VEKLDSAYGTMELRYREGKSMAKAFGVDDSEQWGEMDLAALTQLRRWRDI
jgi:hypothetical protein